MAQTKLQSLAETFSNTGVGMIGSWLIVTACVKNIHDPYICSTAIVVFCTAWSLSRGYAVRRYFNKRAG